MITQRQRGKDDLYFDESPFEEEDKVEFWMLVLLIVLRVILLLLFLEVKAFY